MSQTGLFIAGAAVTMVVFTVVFGKLAGFSEKKGMNFETYAVLTLAGLLPW
mgnify:CR=1 FL=1